MPRMSKKNKIEYGAIKIAMKTVAVCVKKGTTRVL